VGAADCTAACLTLHMVIYAYGNTSGMYTTMFGVQDALSGVDSFQHSAALWLRGFNDEKPRTCKETPAPLRPLSHTLLHPQRSSVWEGLFEGTHMHDDIACCAGSAGTAAGAESCCGCGGWLPHALSRDAGKCLNPVGTIATSQRGRSLGTLADGRDVQKEASQEHSVSTVHACGEVRMGMVSDSAGKRACALTEDLANEGAAETNLQLTSECLLVALHAEGGAARRADPQKHSGIVVGECGRASRHACEAPQFPCIRDAAARAINCAVAQKSGEQALATEFEARLRVAQEPPIEGDGAASACAHAPRHCTASRCGSIGTCKCLQSSSPGAGFSGDCRHVACNIAEGMLRSQNTSPQRSGGEGILHAAVEGGAQLGGHGGGSVAPHAARSSADVGESAKKAATHEPVLCMKCAKDEQRTQKLLGESGEVYDAARQALAKIQDVHVSDELMHFEFWGPFWELTEVCSVFLLAYSLTFFLTFLLSFHPVFTPPTRI
jgi:hypothetical protein